MSIRPTPNITGYAALRADLMHLADEENRLRLALVDVQKTKSEAITKLVEAAERIFGKAVNEHDAHGELRREFKTDTNVQAVVAFAKPGRKCSNCAEPGHTARTCMNERKEKIIVYGSKVSGKSVRDDGPLKVKKLRKPMSPERREKAIEALKKARAARGKK